MAENLEKEPKNEQKILVFSLSYFYRLYFNLSKFSRLLDLLYDFLALFFFFMPFKKSYLQELKCKGYGPMQM